MKKLLSLLSVLTISGTTIPTTIAANSYEENKLININDEIRQIQQKIYYLENEIENKILEETDERKKMENYNKLYAENYDTGYLRYLDESREKIRRIIKEKKSMQNEKNGLTEYLKNIR
ncbi:MULTISPECIES: hypothetical protein [unclassified Spiroplasma]|uniref:hypothetical protein n=1 Tax=unclassified Spiroplasma TaxID=2637901 RepID=UPI0030D47822